MTEHTDPDGRRSGTEHSSLRDRVPDSLQPFLLVSEYVGLRAQQVPRKYIVAGAAAFALMIVASNPAAAQEFCEDPAGQLLINVETLLVNYGTMIIVLGFLIGVGMWALTPFFAGQSAIGLGMILLAFGAAIAFVVGTQFFGMTFEAANVGGQTCSTVIE